MITNDTTLRVRYAETDQMSYVYYGTYAQYHEVGRVELIRSLGLSYRQMEETHKVMMPVVSMNLRYIRPAFYDELLTIRTTVRSLPEKYFDFHTEIFKENGKLCNGGMVRLCFVDMHTQKTILCPKYLIAIISKYFDHAL
ncbi:MAG: acyl-CoA thioesterase [Saprospiraceae bacterium]|nr:acyl-CoA thioesterase [Saprospiraceae bacterium]